jgi:drug/metabolite transporter (DMT)-like permease
MPTNPRAIAILQTLGILILMSIGTVLSKIALHDVPPFMFTALTLLVGMIAMTIYTFGLRRERLPRGLGRAVWVYIVAIGVCNFVIGRIAQNIALGRLPATTSVYLTNFIGFITMAMSVFILREAPTIFQLAGAAVAFSGLWVFFDVPPDSYELGGMALVFVGITAVAYTNNIARKLALLAGERVSTAMISTLALLIGGAITVVVGLIADWPPRAAGLGSWLFILYNGVVMVALGLTVWNYVLRTLRSYEASILGASTVIWTSLLAVLLLGERLAWNQIAGMGLMVVGLALVQVRAGRLRLAARPAR